MRGSSGPRAAITGIGVVSPFGVGRECFWSRVRAGASATRAVTRFDTGDLPSRVAAEVPPVSIEDAVHIADRAPPRADSRR
jgi:3-oxoacyl-(acyl-carrier-protein) synthase